MIRNILLALVLWVGGFSAVWAQDSAQQIGRAHV